LSILYVHHQLEYSSNDYYSDATVQLCETNDYAFTVVTRNGAFWRAAEEAQYGGEKNEPCQSIGVCVHCDDIGLVHYIIIYYIIYSTYSYSYSSTYTVV
jgi:hypothetical protein